MVVIVALSLLTWNLLNPPMAPKYEKIITRNVDSQAEERVLAAAESINYSDICSLERFDGSSDPEAYLHPGTYLAYTFANFVDSEVINYYQTRFDSQQGKADPKGMKLTYEANVTRLAEFRIFNSPAPEGRTWHNNTVVISDRNGSVVLKEAGNMQFFLRNQSLYEEVEWGFDFDFSNCYFVEVKLVYSEYYAPVAAFWSDVDQIVVLDVDLVPVFVGVESSNVVA